MRKWAITGAVAGLAVGTTSAMAANVPIPLTTGSFNNNVVMGSATGAYTDVTAGMDGGIYALPGSNYQNAPFGGDTFYAEGYNTGASGTGIPLGQTIASAANASTTFAFQSATDTYNTFVVTNQTVGSRTGTLALSSPTAYSTLAFLGVGNSGSMDYTINFQGGGTQTGTLTFPGWFNVVPSVAFSAEGRVEMTGTTNPDLSVNLTGVGGFDSVGNPDGCQLYEEDLTVTDTTDPIESITLTDTSGATYESDAIFAVSGQAVPEPVSLGLFGIGVAGMLTKRRGRKT